MNVTKGMTKNYEQMDTWSIGKNEPKTNPNEPKTNPKQTQYKANQTQFQRQKNAAFDDYRPFIGIDYRRQII